MACGFNSYSEMLNRNKKGTKKLLEKGHEGQEKKPFEDVSFNKKNRKKKRR